MQVVRIADACAYSAPGHDGMQMLRLQGKDVSGLRSMWGAVLHLEPGGGTDLKASQQEKLYLVLTGEVSFHAGKHQHILRPMDSCCFLASESRQLTNVSNAPATVLLVMQEADTADKKP